MASCDLSIDLDRTREDHSYDVGETIRGTVRVRVDKDVNCSGLEVRTLWATHGRGNVDSKVVDSKIVDAGQWSAGQTKEYPFELTVGGWPPTYHGHHLNVDHYVEARAKIPWGFDPKASLPFQMKPSRYPDDAASTPGVMHVSPNVLRIIAILATMTFMGVGFGIGAAGGWIMMAIFFCLAGAVGVFVLLRFVLPGFMLGEVMYRLEPDTVAPGQALQGELTIKPKKNISINAITLQLTARERCVSGSGSNRKTHTHDIFDTQYILQDATTLSPSKVHRFPLDLKLPNGAPYSMDLRDNQLRWNAELRVDIPRWPDWTRSLPIRVLPSGDTPVSQHRASEPIAMAEDSPSIPSPDSSTGDITFAETARHLWSVRENREQTAMLVDAVKGLTFDMQATVERRLLYAGDDDPHVYQDGYAVWAHYPDPELPMVLYVPHELADEFEQIGREDWHGRGTIVGWDKRHGRLQVKLERT